MTRGGQPVSQRVTGRFHPAGQAELAVDGGQVPLDGGRAEVQLRGDLLVAHPGGQQPQHLGLPGGQPARQRARRVPPVSASAARTSASRWALPTRRPGLRRPQVPGGLVGPAEPVAGAAEAGQRLHRVVTVAGLLISGDRRRVVPGRLSPLPLMRRDVALVALDGTDQLRVAEIGGEFRGLGQGPGRGLPLAGPGQQVAQVGQADRERLALAELALDHQGLLEQLAGPGQVAVVHLEQGHVVDRGGQGAAVAQAGPQVHGRGEAAPGRGPVAQVAVRRAEHGGGGRGAVRHAQRLEDPQRQPGLADRLAVVAVLGGQQRPPSRTRARPARRAAGPPGRGTCPARPGRAQPAAEQPPAPQRRAHVQARGGVAVLVRPVQCLVQVGGGGLQPGGPVRRVRPGQAGLAALGQLGEMRACRCRTAGRGRTPPAGPPRRCASCPAC